MSIVVFFFSKSRQLCRKQNILPVVLVVIVFLSASFLFLYKLEVEPLHNDEARYSEIVTESFLNSNHAFDLVYRGQPYFNKPPLLFWLIDISHWFVGDMQLAVRLPSAIGAIMLVCAVMVVVYEVTKSLYAAAFGGSILATTASLVILSRAGRFDSLASLFVLLATYAFLQGLTKRKWFLLFGVCIGLVIITKGPVVIFAGVTVLALAWINRRIDWLQDPYFWGGICIALLIVLPWHLYETIKYGAVFWNEYVLEQIIGRAQKNIVSISLPLSNKNYCLYLLEFLAPWSFLFLAGLATLPILLKRFSRKSRALLFASLYEILAVLVICFLVASKAYRYLMPLFPFLAISVAIIFFEISRLCIPHIRSALAISFIALGIYAFTWSAYNGFLLNPLYPFSTDTPASANDERQIATFLISRGAKNFYVYDTADIDGIMYYSQLTNPYYFPLYGYYPGLYFILPSSEISLFESIHPNLKFTILYAGSDLVLGEEIGEASESLPLCNK